MLESSEIFLGLIISDQINIYETSYIRGNSNSLMVLSYVMKSKQKVAKALFVFQKNIV